jgi:CheY-like chemotaxis protein
MAASFVPNDEDVERQAYGEFLDEVRDTLNAMQVVLGNLRSGTTPEAEALSSLRRGAHNLRAAGLAVESPLIKLITHRLDEYLSELRAPQPQHMAEIEVFLDKITAVCDGEIPDQTDAVQVVRTLPRKRRFDVDFGSIEQKNIEVLMVIPEKAMSRIVERELAACGYHVSNVHNPFQAIEMVVRTKPDMVITAMELDQLSGVDLACALSNMAPTQHIPCAVLTSYEWGHPKLRGLPPRAAIIHKGPRFGDDLADTFAKFGIT